MAAHDHTALSPRVEYRRPERGSGMRFVLLLAAAACTSDTDGEDTPSPDAPVDTDDPTEPPPPPEDTDDSPPTTEPCPVYVQVGTGEFTWEALEPLDEVEMVH